MLNEGKKPKILIFTGYYLPGFKGGGPIKSIANLVSGLSDYFEFMIVTRDRDLSDITPYDGIQVDCWQMVEGAKVIYLSPSKVNVFNIRKILIETKCDAIYLNGFFDPNFSIKPLWICRYLKVSKAPILIAPRGEFSKGAISIKKEKKLTYIRICNFLRIYKGCAFQASSEYEAKDILDFIKIPDKSVRVALNVPDISTPLSEELHKGDTSNKRLKVVFLSRISEKKNLRFAIRVLSLTSSSIDFDIYGPIEDLNYWAECEALIQELPSNVRANYRGEVQPENVKSIFSEYDLFLFPTLGENFGHVIAESLLAGTPVLTSDQTPWRNLKADGLGWDLPLSDELEYSKIIDSFSATSALERYAERYLRSEKTKVKLNASDILAANINLFNSLFDRV
ncbi:glycosyltransferase family 4 protein [Terasakiella sp.]|uniref:glycosyltransferase family 4 protein n=1 Tax=Terasakiella sp. TaxID=2034861 RepID=UPI003AA8A183